MCITESLCSAAEIGTTLSINYCCRCSAAKLCPALATPWTAARQAPLSSTISWCLLTFMSIESVMLSNSAKINYTSI